MAEVVWCSSWYFRPDNCYLPYYCFGRWQGWKTIGQTKGTQYKICFFLVCEWVSTQSHLSNVELWYRRWQLWKALCLLTPECHVVLTGRWAEVGSWLCVCDCILTVERSQSQGETGNQQERSSRKGVGTGGDCLISVGGKNPNWPFIWIQSSQTLRSYTLSGVYPENICP